MADSVIVTGASGYIGGETLLRLKDQGFRVIAIDTVIPPDHLKGLADRFYQEDFSKGHSLSLIDQFEPRAIIHCAGSSLVGPSLARPADYYHNNFVKTKLLLDRLIDRHISTRLIFSSSAACYGEPSMIPCSESDPCDPISPYGQSKIMIEWMLESYAQAYGIDYVAFRYFNACGADSQNRHGQRPGATHIIARVLESMKNSNEFVLNGEDFSTPDGTCVRDYVHVEDIADAHIRAINKDVAAGVYNLGTNQGFSNRQIMEAAERITKRKIKHSVGPRRPGDPAVLTASAAKFSVAADWQPRFGLEHMIQHAWAWYNK